MSKNLKTEAVDHLFDAILCLKDRAECYTFFEDVCTVNELFSLSQRFEVAKMLREQKTYLDIAEKTGASTATISRVNRSLNYGNDGYDMVFSRMEDGSDKEDYFIIGGKKNRLINLSLFFYFPFLNVYFHGKKPLFLHLDCQSCAQSAFS